MKSLIDRFLYFVILLFASIIIFANLSQVLASDPIVQYKKVYLKDQASINKIGLLSPALASSWNFTLPTTAGTSGQTLITDGSGITSWATPSGGGGTPGGVNGNVQYNSGGTFGGSNNLFWDNANARLGVGLTTPLRGIHLKNGGGELRLETNSTVVASGGTALVSLVDSSGQVGTMGFAGLANSLQISADGASGFIRFLTAGGAERVRIDALGSVGIGVTPASSHGILQVGSQTGLGSWSGGSGPAISSFVDSSHVIGGGGNIRVLTKDSQATNLGGAIALGGNYITTANSVDFAEIAGRKENSTSGNSAGYMSLGTRINSGNIVENMRIDSIGNVGIGQATIGTTTRLHVEGPYSDFSGGFGGGPAHFKVMSSSAGAINVGGQIGIGGKTGNPAPDYIFAGLKGYKETAGGDGLYSGSLAFYTTSTGGVLGESFRLNGAGQAYIPNTTGGGIGNIPHNCAIVNGSGSGLFSLSCPAGKIALGCGCVSDNNTIGLSYVDIASTSCTCRRTDSSSLVIRAHCCTY